MNPLPAPLLETEMVWPYGPGEDLPQIIVFLLTDGDGLISSIWWAEAMGCISMGVPKALTPNQLERMARWLDLWLTTDSQRFTEEGTKAVQRMIRDINRCLGNTTLEAQWRLAVESDVFDHEL